MFTHKHECLFCTLKFYHLHQNNSGVLGSPGLEFHLAIRNSGNCAASRHQFPQFYWLNSKDFFAGFWIQALGSGRFTRILHIEMEISIAPLVALKIWWLGCGMKLVRLEMETKFTPLESGIGGVRLLEIEHAVQMWWSEAKHMASADCYKGFWMLNLKFLKLLVLPLQCELGFFPGALIGLSALVAYQADGCYGWTGRFIKMECGMIPEITFYGPSPHVSTS